MIGLVHWAHCGSRGAAPRHESVTAPNRVSELRLWGMRLSSRSVVLASFGANGKTNRLHLEDCCADPLMKRFVPRQRFVLSI